MPHSNGFANLDRHKLDERRPAPAKTHLRPVSSKRYASDRRLEILATAVIAALILIAAKWFAV